MPADKAFRLVKSGRRWVLLVFRVGPAVLPACIGWERVTSRDLPAVRAELAARGIPELSANPNLPR